ncbi:MAG: sensor histidine kinase [Gammaproteobacteria bacterium]
MKRQGIRAKLIRVFALQVAIISVATIAGIFIANTLIVDMVLREGLRNEAEYYWNRFDQDASASLPDTSNMRSYMAIDGDLNGVPEVFWHLPADAVVRTVDEGRQLVHVSERGNHRLYLVWAKSQIYNIAFFFGIVPLTVVLLIIYGLAFLAYRLSHRAISPVVQLAQQLEQYDFDRDRSLTVNLDPLRDAADAEVLAMIEALDSFSGRMQAFVERERIFTRDAGHELRTPVAVLKGSLDLLEDRADRPLPERNALRRMRQTVDDMEALLETLLMLARESEIELPRDAVLVNDLVARQVELLQATAARGGNRLGLHEDGEFRVRAPPKVVEIVIGNLLRNAANYTREGSIDVTVTARSVRVSDSGVGMSSDELEKAFEPFYRVDQSRGLTKGHGLGLSIVKRLVRQFGWSISAHSRPGEGTTMEIRF